jgi:hypothetical protein
MLLAQGLAKHRERPLAEDRVDVLGEVAPEVAPEHEQRLSGRLELSSEGADELLGRANLPPLNPPMKRMVDVDRASEPLERRSATSAALPQASTEFRPSPFHSESRTRVVTPNRAALSSPFRCIRARSPVNMHPSSAATRRGASHSFLLA